MKNLRFNRIVLCVAFATVGATVSTHSQASRDARFGFQLGSLAQPLTNLSIEMNSAFDALARMTNFDLFSFDSTGFGPTVLGKPYSAEVLQERSQLLADGNRIAKKTQTKMARDNEGRVRQESVVNGKSRAWISDPVANKTIVLDLDAKTATVSEGRGRDMMGADVRKRIDEAKSMAESAGKAAGEAAKRARETGHNVGDAVRSALAGIAPQPFINNHVEVITLDKNQPATQWSWSSSEAWPDFSWPVSGKHAASQEPLGTKVIEGVSAEGVRRTTTIPTGEIGNEKPIVISSEVWKSPELGLTVFSRQIDPRKGESVYRLQSVSRENPAANLFSVPDGFKTIESKSRVRVWKS